jgi:hypothetical protein
MTAGTSTEWKSTQCRLCRPHGGRHRAGQNPEGRERHYCEEGQKSPCRCGAAAVAIVAIHVTFLPTYSGIISQAAGFCLIVLPSRSPDKAKPALGTEISSRRTGLKPPDVRGHEYFRRVNRTKKGETRK